MRSVLIGMLAIFGVTLMGASSCESEPTAHEKGAAKQEQVANAAQRAVPVPEVDHFINRKAVAEYMKRMDDPSKTFYVYVLGLDGSVIGYFVTRTHPISICSLLTPSDRVEHGHVEHGNSYTMKMNAPTLNGLYANGADGCDHYYAFTADSDTLIEFSQDFFISDQPLPLEADQLAQ